MYATLHITGMQPGLGGGTLVADVIDYEMRESRRKLVIGRVRVDQ